MSASLPLHRYEVVVHAPATGPLGISLLVATSGRTYPVIDAVRENSCLAGRVQAGDSLMKVGPHTLIGWSLARVVECLASLPSRQGGSAHGTRTLVVLRSKRVEVPQLTPYGGCSSTSEEKQGKSVAATKASQGNPKPRAKANSTRKRPPPAVAAPARAAKPASKPTSVQIATGKENAPIELLDSDSDDNMTVTIRAKATTKFKREPGVQAKDVTDGDIGAPTLSISAKRRARFPHTIDTGFNGNAVKEVVPIRFGHLQQIRLRRSTSFLDGLPFIWPAATPVPSSTGGFYEVLDTVVSMAGGATKRRKLGNERKTHSKIARLGGTITINARMMNSSVASLCLCDVPQKFVLADDLYREVRAHTLYSTQGHPMISTKAQEVLQAIQNLNDKDNPFGERCLYVLAETPVAPVSLFNFERVRNAVVELKFHVYFRRALVGLSANPNIKTVLDALEAMPNTEPWSPCRQVRGSTHHYQHSKHPHHHGSRQQQHRFEHSLPGILWANESTGYPLTALAVAPAAASASAARTSASKDDYQTLTVKLRDYQAESVAWMRNQENLNAAETGGGVAGLNGYFWERRTLADGDVYYYFPLGGQILLTPPPVVSGGLLAEEMVLLSYVCMHLFPSAKPDPLCVLYRVSARL
jgi:hypothetical protein